jgi:hypothetical protein
MYKTRFNEWQIFKNHKAVEKEEVARHLEVHRKLGVDLGQPMIRGQEVKAHRIARYLREKRKADSARSEPVASVQSEPVRTELTACEDGRPAKRARARRQLSACAISFSTIQDPGEYRDTENLLFQIDHYFNSRLEGDPQTAWRVWTESSRPADGATKIQYTYQRRTYTATFLNSNNLYAQFYCAAVCFIQSRFQDGWRLIQEGVAMIRTCLLHEDPQFVSTVLLIVSEPALHRYSELLDLLLRYIADMAQIVLGKRHPITNMCRALQAFRGSKHVAYLTQKKHLDLLIQHLGNDHEDTLCVQIALLRHLRRQKRLDEVKRVAREFTAVCEDYLTRLNLQELAMLDYDGGEIIEAVDILVDVLVSRETDTTFAGYPRHVTQF